MLQKLQMQTKVSRKNYVYLKYWPHSITNNPRVFVMVHMRRRWEGGANARREPLNQPTCTHHARLDKRDALFVIWQQFHVYIYRYVHIFCSIKLVLCKPIWYMIAIHLSPGTAFYILNKLMFLTARNATSPYMKLCLDIKFIWYTTPSM